MCVCALIMYMHCHTSIDPFCRRFIPNFLVESAAIIPGKSSHVDAHLPTKKGLLSKTGLIHITNMCKLGSHMSWWFWRNFVHVGIIAIRVSRLYITPMPHSIFSFLFRQSYLITCFGFNDWWLKCKFGLHNFHWHIRDYHVNMHRKVLEWHSPTSQYMPSYGMYKQR